jgi:hypothetical protein
VKVSNASLSLVTIDPPGKPARAALTTRAGVFPSSRFNRSTIQRAYDAAVINAAVASLAA